jgi:hypothetical protein
MLLGLFLFFSTQCGIGPLSSIEEQCQRPGKSSKSGDRPGYASTKKDPSESCRSDDEKQNECHPLAPVAGPDVMLGDCPFKSLPMLALLLKLMEEEFDVSVKTPPPYAPDKW